VIILDTDALGHLQKGDPVGDAIQAQLDASGDRDLRITAVAAYEMVSGAVDLIDRGKRQRRDIIPAFCLLHDLVEYLGLSRGLILPYEARAEQVYRGFPARLRQDLKDDARIAAIALTHAAAVWTCNTTDFAQVPGLTVVQAETGTRVP
jgi:predicted nucleic acid-binding protein